MTCVQVENQNGFANRFRIHLTKKYFPRHPCLLFLLCYVIANYMSFPSQSNAAFLLESCFRYSAFLHVLDKSELASNEMKGHHDSNVEWECSTEEPQKTKAIM